MNNDIDKQPSFESGSFDCPLCTITAHQNWEKLGSYRFSDTKS